MAGGRIGSGSCLFRTHIFISGECFLYLQGNLWIVLMKYSTVTLPCPILENREARVTVTHFYGGGGKILVWVIWNAGLGMKNTLGNFVNYFTKYIEGWLYSNHQSGLLSHLLLLVSVDLWNWTQGFSFSTLVFTLIKTQLMQACDMT